MLTKLSYLSIPLLLIVAVLGYMERAQSREAISKLLNAEGSPSSDLQYPESIKEIEAISPGSTQALRENMKDSKFPFMEELKLVHKYRGLHLNTASSESVLQFASLRVEDIKRICLTKNGDLALNQIYQKSNGDFSLEKVSPTDFKEGGDLESVKKSIDSAPDKNRGRKVDSVTAQIIKTGNAKSTNPPIEGEYDRIMNRIAEKIPKEQLELLESKPQSCDSQKIFYQYVSSLPESEQVTVFKSILSDS